MAFTSEQLLEQRVIDLEKKLEELTRKVTGAPSSPNKDWRSTVGMLPHDELSEEADRLGREWREKQTEP